MLPSYFQGYLLDAPERATKIEQPSIIFQITIV